MNRTKLMTIIYLSIIGVFLLLFGFFQIAPYYTGQLLVIFGLVVGYISTEQWITHDAAEFENRFWTLVAFLFCSASVTCSDSPFYFTSENRAISWFVVLLITYAAHNFDRYLHRCTLTKNNNLIKRIKSADFDHTNRTNARLLLVELQKQINSIDLIWMSSTFLNFFFLPYVLSCEKKILQIFSESNQQEINYLLYQCKLPLILYKIKDHKFAQRYSRSELLQLLAEERVHELNVASKAILLDALQRLKLSAHTKNEYYVQKIILSTKGNDLSELKCLTDAKGDFNSMLKLIFEDIRNPEIRAAILNHIMKEANIQSAHQAMKTKHWKNILTKFAWMKIISDVDDTLSCSGGSWPKGMDLSYPPKIIYPGVIGFYRELDLGTAGSVEEWDSTTRIGNLAFLSARPHVYKDVSESFTYDTFRILQQNYHLHTSPTLLPGSLDAGGKFMVNLDSEPLARKKFENFQNYLRIYPEFQFIFIGDNGQGDVRTAELMHEENMIPSSSATATVSSASQATNNNLCRCYIHIVQPIVNSYVKNTLYRKPLMSTEKTCSNMLHPSAVAASNYVVGRKKEHKICYFNCYVEAAIDAYYHNLIRVTGLRRIMVESVTEFQAIKEKSWQMDNPYDESALIDHDTKITSPPGRLVKITEEAAVTTEVPIKPAPRSATSSLRRLSGTFAALTTPVPSPTPATAQAMFPVATTAKQEAAVVSSSHDEEESVQHYRDKLILFTNHALRVRNGFVKRELRLRELNDNLVKANEILQQHEMDPVETMDYPQIYPVGRKVKTVFGIGEIKQFRSKDGIYEVEVTQTFGEMKSGKKSDSANTEPAPEVKAIVTKLYVAGMYLYQV